MRRAEARCRRSAGLVRHFLGLQPQEHGVLDLAFQVGLFHAQTAQRLLQRAALAERLRQLLLGFCQLLLQGGGGLKAPA